MKNKNSLSLLSSILLLTALLFTLSCSKKEDNFPPHISTNGVTLVLNLQTATISDGGVRALQIEDENQIKEVSLLLFNKKDKEGEENQADRLVDMPLVKPISDNNGWQADMQASNTYSSAVVLVNCKELIDTDFLTKNKDKTREEVLQSLIITKDQWDANTTNEGYRPIPMWGELKDLKINADAGTLQAINFNMVRMLARINVSVKKGVENIQLREVHLINANDHGSVAPADNNLESLTKVKAPTIPEDAAKPENPISSGLIYQVTNETNALLNEIYTFEAAAGTDAEMLHNTALIIGTALNDEEETSYFRLDFKTATGYLALLRNHSYNINITGVTGNGYNTPEEAFKSLNSGLQFNIVEWNDIDIDTELGGGNKDGNSEDNGDAEGDAEGEDIEDEPTTAVASSNCYIVKPGEAITFPISRVNESHLGVQLPVGTPYQAQLVWQDKQNLIENIETIDQGGDQRYICVTTNNNAGNAVVAATDEDGAILWSWHIWVVDYTPEGEWMDRNLGALRNDCSNDSEMNDFMGCYYQWGRKDPFPSAGNYPQSLLTRKTLYDINNTEVKIKSVDAAETKSLQLMISNPTALWDKASYWSQITELDPSNLWNNDGSKTFYDPCPEGYRVPVYSDNNPPWEKGENPTYSDYAMNSPEHGGYYPFSGIIKATTISDVGSEGNYWTATTISDKNTKTLTIIASPSSRIFPKYDDEIFSRELSVRCIKE